MNIEVNQVLIDAFAKLRERVKPAVLDQNAYTNGTVLKNYLDQKGYNVANMDADALADALYEAVNAEAERLKWTVKPAKLTKFAQNEKQRNQSTAQKEQEAFVEKARKSEKDDQYQKKQAATKKQIDQMIENVLFVDGFNGRIAHGKTEAVKDTLRKHLDKAVKSNRDLTVVSREVQKYIHGQYEAAEKAVEHV